jgi:hypothetical protein
VISTSSQLVLPLLEGDIPSTHSMRGHLNVLVCGDFHVIGYTAACGFLGLKMSLSGTEETVALVSWLVTLAPVLVHVMAPFIPATTGTTGVVIS